MLCEIAEEDTNLVGLLSYKYLKLDPPTSLHASWLLSHTFMSQIRFTALWYATAMLRIDPQDTPNF